MSRQSLGTFISCTNTSRDCLWIGENGNIVNSETLRQLMIQHHYNIVANEVSQQEAERNLKIQMEYIEMVHYHAKVYKHTFHHQMGVTYRHLLNVIQRIDTPEEFVKKEVMAEYKRQERVRQRQLQDTTTKNNVFNWCTNENTLGRSVCSSVKSQSTCGSCWAFAAADTIETAVAINSNDNTEVVALSPQQFLDCSRSTYTQTFTYCWVNEFSGGYPGAPWLQAQIPWKSTNAGCNGGMTHGAFMDAAFSPFGLVSDLTLPYQENDANNSNIQAEFCTANASNQSAASITGYEQVVGKDCSLSGDPNFLLRKAVEIQPVSVAITSVGSFNDYKGGFYACPNDGELTTQDMVNHAIMLVGYGNDPTHGEYWILKNSYGVQWGDQGYLKLLADSKVNCGLNIFPIVPTGAKKGFAQQSVDGGGKLEFLGISPQAWLSLAIVLSIATIVATLVGAYYTYQKRKNFRLQHSNVNDTTVTVVESPQPTSQPRGYTQLS